MFFKRKPKPPLMNAIHMVISGTQIAQIYQHDRTYIPSKSDLSLLDMLTETLLRNYTTMERITREMHQRAQGEPEDTQEFIETKVFDYQCAA